MSYFVRWIEEAEELINKVAPVVKSIGLVHHHVIPASLSQQAMVEISVVTDTVRDMKHSKIIKIPDHQVQVFMDIPINMDQDFTLMRSPFPSIFLDLQPPLTFKNYYDGAEKVMIPEVPIKAVMITEGPPKMGQVFLEDGSLRDMSGIKFQRVWCLKMFMPIDKHPENVFTCTFGVLEDGSFLAPAVQYLDKKTMEQHRRFTNTAIHIMNYLTSPTLTLEQHEHNFALQKKRAKNNKPPLPEWYEIRYSKTKHTAPGATGEGSKHTFRYDVRGHFKHVKVGKLAGRMIWTPAHQRGLANETYRPKTYQL